MVAEVYDALKSAGADDTLARKAAEAVAETAGRMQSTESGLRGEMHGIRIEMQALRSELRLEMQAVRSELGLEMQAIRGEMSTLKWMNGGLLGVAIAIFVRMLFA